MTRRSRFIARTQLTLKRSRLLRWGVGATALWFGFLLIYLVSFADWAEFKKPNQFGDFFAGVFAPVAFLWLVITVLIQSRELKLQRRELQQNRSALELQAAELKANVEQITRQTELLKIQVDATTRDKQIKYFEREYENLVDLLLQALGALDRYIPFDEDVVFYSNSELRKKIRSEGLAAVLKQQSQMLRNAFKTPFALSEFFKSEQTFTESALRFQKEFTAWREAVEIGENPELKLRPIGDGVSEMHACIQEVLKKAKIPGDHK